MRKLLIAILLLAVATESPAQKWLKSVGKVLGKVEQVADRLSGNQGGKESAKGSKPVTFTYGDVTVATTLPNFTVALGEVRRVSRECGAISLTFTNNSSASVRLYGLNVMKSLTDSKGNDYSAYGKWELKIGNQTIRRYGTDNDYTFPAGKPVTLVWYVYGLPGEAKMEAEKVGTFMKTTTRLPSVTIQSFGLEPNIVYQQENLRRSYTLEVTGLRIPAYVHIDREGIDKETDDDEEVVPDRQDTPRETSDKDSGKAGTSDNKGVIVTTAGNRKEDTWVSDCPPGPKESDDVGKGNGDNKDKVTSPENSQKGNGEPPKGPETTEGGPIKTEEQITICGPLYPPTTDEDSLWRAYIQPILNRQVSYVELRSDVHFTNEPRGDWTDGMRATCFSLSSAEYERFEGIFFEYVDPELQFKDDKNNGRHIAEMYSSYPRKGTRCGIISFIDPEYKKGMKRRKDREGVPFYGFLANTLTLDKIEAIETREVNGVLLKIVVFTVTDTPTKFALAYDKAIMGDRASRKTETLYRGLSFVYDKKTGEWKRNDIGTMYNPKTKKWEKWFLV